MVVSGYIETLELMLTDPPSVFAVCVDNCDPRLDISRPLVIRVQSTLACGAKRLRSGFCFEEILCTARKALGFCALQPLVTGKL